MNFISMSQSSAFGCHGLGSRVSGSRVASIVAFCVNGRLHSRMTPR